MHIFQAISHNVFRDKNAFLCTCCGWGAAQQNLGKCKFGGIAAFLCAHWFRNCKIKGSALRCNPNFSLILSYGDLRSVPRVALQQISVLDWAFQSRRATFSHLKAYWAPSVQRENFMAASLPLTCHNGSFDTDPVKCRIKLQMCNFDSRDQVNWRGLFYNIPLHRG